MEPPQGWEGRARCRYVDPELFFDRQGPDALGRPTMETRAQRWMAKALYCYACPVARQCLDRHFDVEFGVFGGVDQGERAVLRAQRAGRSVRQADRVTELIASMTRAGISAEDIAERLDLSSDRVRATVSAWRETGKGRRAEIAWQAWRLLYDGCTTDAIRAAVQLDEPTVWAMRKALAAVEGRLKTPQRAARATVPTQEDVHCPPVSGTRR